MTGPCAIKWCTCLTLEGKTVCAAHFKDRDLRPLTYKRPPRVKHWPPTPWDDERPWYEERRQ